MHGKVSLSHLSPVIVVKTVTQHTWEWYTQGVSGNATIETYPWENCWCNICDVGLNLVVI